MGDGCSLCAARSGYKHLPWWCDLCTVEAQAASLRATAAKLPEAEKRLEQLKSEPSIVLFKDASGAVITETMTKVEFARRYPGWNTGE